MQSQKTGRLGSLIPGFSRANGFKSGETIADLNWLLLKIFSRCGKRGGYLENGPGHEDRLATEEKYQTAMKHPRTQDTDSSAGQSDGWRRYISEILARSGIDNHFLERYYGRIPPSLPAGAAEYFTLSNMRLAELRSEYISFSCDAADHSQWNASYLAAELDVQSFRADSAFVWQYCDVNLLITYLLTYYYLRSLGLGPDIEKRTEDELFGVYAIRADEELLTRDRLDSVCELAVVSKTLDVRPQSSVNLLDIGSGYGRFAYRAVQYFDNVAVWCPGCHRGINVRLRILPVLSAALRAPRSCR